MDIKLRTGGMPEVHSRPKHNWTPGQLDAALVAGVQRLCKAAAPDSTEPSLCMAATLTMAVCAATVARAVLAHGDADAIRHQYGKIVEGLRLEVELLATLVKQRQNPPPPPPKPVKTIRREKDGTFTVEER